MRNASQPEKETIGHEAEVKGSHSTKIRQGLGYGGGGHHGAAGVMQDEGKGKKKCKCSLGGRYGI